MIPETGEPERSANVPPAFADVVVVGGGIAGLVAARECLKVGLATVVVEQRDRLGGCVGSADLGGLRVDTGAESFATRGGSVAELIDELGLTDEIVGPNPAGAWLVLPDGSAGSRAVPLPKTGILGIPSSPLADDVRAVVGTGGAIRAYADRVMPILKIGKETNLGALVRKRMGAKVLDLLVKPIASGVYSADPDELEVEAVAPGLNAAMTRAGSLSGGVAELTEARTSGGAVLGLRGGMGRLVDAVIDGIRHLAGTLATGRRVVALERMPAPDAPFAWRLRTEGPDGETVIDARYVVLACPAAAAVPLLAGARAEWAALAEEAWPAGASVDIVTLLLDAPVLDAAPRGTGVLVAAGTPGVGAKALTHSTAKWGWLAEAAGGRHVVRLSYGRAGQANPLDGLADREVALTALRDASELLGTALDERHLRVLHRTPWRDALSHAAIGQRDRVRALEEALAADPTVVATGSWLAGTGLASVVPHARKAAARIRHDAVHVSDTP